MNIIEILNAAGEETKTVRRKDHGGIKVYNLRRVSDEDNYEGQTFITWFRIEKGLMVTWFAYPPPMRGNYLSRIALHELALVHDDYEFAEAPGRAHAMKEVIDDER